MLIQLQIEDKPGQQEIVLTREYNGEKIRVTFTIADLNNVEEPENDEDSAMYDNDVDDIVDGQSGGANTKGAINQGNTKDGNFRIAPEDRIAPADREELEDEYDEDNQPEGFPARAHIRIERPGKGALSIEATAQDGDFLIEDLAWFENAENADPQTAEANWSKQSLYAGPPFANLDEDLQLLMEKYLEERGINTRLALFIPDYIDHKEQKEYIRWLKSKSRPHFRCFITAVNNP
jgi:complement component 1 Q subcomponent-binding protein